MDKTKFALAPPTDFDAQVLKPKEVDEVFLKHFSGCQ